MNSRLPTEQSPPPWTNGSEWMRLDDYQKWLDSMFVDEPAPPEPEPVEELPPVEVVAEPAVATVSATSIAAAAQSAPAHRESSPAIAARQVPGVRPTSAPDEEEVPQIDDYLPFRRVRQVTESVEPAA